MVRRVLVVRLRSIGDTVLATPSLRALKRFIPHAEVDILLEDWVAPLLQDSKLVDNIISVDPGLWARMHTAWQIRRRHYDVAFNLHGGTTGTFFTYASGAAHRVGYNEFQYSFLYNHLLSSSSDYWKKSETHSAEQQLALLGSVGVPVEDRPRSELPVSDAAMNMLKAKLSAADPSLLTSQFALFHPTAAFATKQWPVENFARAAEFLHDRGVSTIAVAAGNEQSVLAELIAESKVEVLTRNDLSLPEITALASRAALFVGNDSGIAHIAAAVGTPAVVIFGSSNIDHWRPWTDAANEVVFQPFECQPCPGYVCRVFGDPKCIKSVNVRTVTEAIDRVLQIAEKGS